MYLLNVWLVVLMEQEFMTGHIYLLFIKMNEKMCFLSNRLALDITPDLS